MRDVRVSQVLFFAVQKSFVGEKKNLVGSVYLSSLVSGLLKILGTNSLVF